MTNDHPRAFEGVFIAEDIWTNPGLTWIEKCITAEISSLDNPENDPRGCFKSNENFAKEFGIQVRQFQNILSKLKKLNLVQANGSNGRKRWLLGYRRIRQIAASLQGNVAHLGCNGLHVSGAFHYQKSVIPLKPPLLRVKKKEERNKEPSSDALVIFNFLTSSRQNKDPGYKKPTNKSVWIDKIDEILEGGKRHSNEVKDSIEFAMENSFWCSQISTPARLKKNFSNLFITMKAANGSKKSSRRFDSPNNENFHKDDTEAFCRGE